MSKKEFLDLVDEDDNIINTLLRAEIYDKNLRYVRVIEGFIKNSQGKLWIPTRNQNKTIAPGGFDVGVGGHVEHGETYLEAFRKEAYEELGWNIDDYEYAEIGKFGPKDGLNTVSMVYEITTNEEPKLNPDDFVSAQWCYPQDIVSKIVDGHPAKSNLAMLLKIVYLAKNKTVRKYL